MKPITTVDKATAKLLSEAIRLQLEGLAQTHGLTLTMKGGTYDALTYSPRMEFKVKATADGKSGEQAEFEKYCRWFNLEPTDYKREFKTLSGTYKLVAFKLGASKMPLVGERPDGQRYKFDARVVNQWKATPTVDEAVDALIAKAGKVGA